MAKKKGEEKPGFGKLLDAWVAPADAGDPIGCVATSFTFSPVFFEEECLARFLQLESEAVCVLCLWGGTVMSSLYPFCSDINLHVTGRISADDASRQETTAREILRRLSNQPGLILADEVGMGKTFVALAVAVSVAFENRGKRPVVVMVPSSLKEKWPADFALFCEKCRRQLKNVALVGRKT